MGCGSSTRTLTPTRHRRVRDENTPPRGNRSDEPVNRRRRDSKPKPDREEFIEEALQAHNEYRSKHSAPPLRIAEDLNEYAQQWADKIARKDAMEHSNCKLKNGERIGENIYFCWSSDPTAGVKAQTAVKSWYDEIKDYNFKRPGFSSNTGHFTQVVWKGTEEMGIAKARSKNGSFFVVANYRPPGNMMGDFERNVGYFTR